MPTTNLSLGQISVTAIAIYFAGWIVYCRYFHPLRSVPGPFLASISRVWIVYKTARGDMEYTERALHNKHGYLVRIAPSEMCCSDPNAIKTIYGTKTGFTKTDYYDAWAPPNNGYVGHFPARDEAEHSERRRIVNNVYSMTSVLESEVAIDSCTQLFCETLRDFAKQKSKVDLSKWLNMYAFDVLGELFYGKKFGIMANRTDTGRYMKAIESLLPAFTIGGTLPSYLTKLYFLSTVLISSSFRGALGAVKHLEVASKAAVEQRDWEVEKNNDEKRDILRKMIEIKADRGDQVNFTSEHVLVESHSSLFAGADTTSTAMTSILYHLLRSPTAYDKLTAEIDAAFTSGQLPMPITYAQATKLPYLNACITEGMRLHPSVGLPLQRYIPPGGATIAGVYLPEGYRVGINAAVVHYDKDVFGSDAEQFNPDRWIDGDAVQMDKAMIPFGAGSRTCIGKNISMSEVYKLTPPLMRLFRFRLADPSRQWTTRNYWFNTVSDVHVYVEERRHQD